MLKKLLAMFLVVTLISTMTITALARSNDQYITEAVNDPMLETAIMDDEVVSSSEIYFVVFIYFPFGVESEPDAGDANPWRYCSEYWDDETGTYYLRARYYSPITGLYISEDPICAGLNWYTYCDNNPILFIDPWGLDCYIFYDASDYESTAKAFQKVLLNFFDTSKKHVILIPVNTADELVTGWNKMGKNASGDVVSIDAVIMIIHANPFVMGTGKGKNEEIFLQYDEFDVLESKNVGSLILISCFAGHLDYSESNIAYQFADKTMGGPVMACDGAPSIPGLFASSLKIGSTDNDSFKYWRDYINPNSTRKQQGWIIYQKGENGKITPSESQGKSLSIKQMLKILSKY